MKPIIGIINREEKLKSENKIEYCYKDIINKIKKSNGIPIGITINKKNDIKEIEKLINGLIIQGGNKYKNIELKLIEYAYKKNIPILGICQGMQMMGIITTGKLKTIKNHNQTTHNVNIKQNTKIYEIIKKEKIKVNSRHNYALTRTTLQVSGISDDNTIEIIEDKTKKFFIGIQWHPESLNNEDSKKIFDYFIKKSKEGKK